MPKLLYPLCGPQVCLQRAACLTCLSYSKHTYLLHEAESFSEANQSLQLVKKLPTFVWNLKVLTVNTLRLHIEHQSRTVDNC
jgi:hypothetical protein